MNVLLLYPQYPDTYWSFKHALKFISKKAINFPLGIITIAAMLPAEWNKKLIDMNVSDVSDKNIQWADFVLISAMAIQIQAVKQLLHRCVSLGKKIVAGGPLFTEEYELFPEVDHFILNEAEITLPPFLEDLKHGTEKRIYRSDQFADITNTPVPLFSLLKHNKYACATVQYSRGCPFECEFCDITALFGRRVRTKTSGQIIAELNALRNIGWKGSVFFVDDNIIGHKQKLKTELLPDIIAWMEKNDYPYNFTAESSINMADDKELIDLMVKANFTKVFIGIETPNPDSLAECNKIQNRDRDLMKNVAVIQEKGIEVTAGFIVGFDHDPPGIFQRQIDFIQNSGIITAMVGLLNAPKLSRLYKRLQQEGRILYEFSGDNTGYAMNFKPLMNIEELLKGYQRIIQGVYSSKQYYGRIKQFIMHFNPSCKITRAYFTEFIAFLKSVYYLGLIQKSRKYFWKLFFWSLLKKPKSLPLE
jgi:radical SAM superfamily enzyme YgiQ (UPF0313 family)